MPLLNYTTTIPATRTMGEMQQLLVEHGARSVNGTYEGGRPVALSFSIETPHGMRSYTLPADPRPVFQLMKDEGVRVKRAGWKLDMDHAERVAWRILKDWLEAQLALISTAMVTLDQVMLPYMHTDEVGTTVYELYERNAMAALPSGT